MTFLSKTENIFMAGIVSPFHLPRRGQIFCRSTGHALSITVLPCPSYSHHCLIATFRDKEREGTLHLLYSTTGETFWNQSIPYHQLLVSSTCKYTIWILFLSPCNPFSLWTLLDSNSLPFLKYSFLR